MKRLSSLFGLVAVLVIMAMTSCTKTNEDVQKVCDTFDSGTEAINDADSQQELEEAVRAFMEDMNDLDKEGIDESVKLSDDDKSALKKAFMDYTTAMAHKIVDLGLSEYSMSTVDDNLDEIEKQLDKILEKSETLGDFAKKVDRIG